MTKDMKFYTEKLEDYTKQRDEVFVKIMTLNPLEDAKELSELYSDVAYLHFKVKQMTDLIHNFRHLFKLEQDAKISEVRKKLENTEDGYYVEYYEDIVELMDERAMDRGRLFDLVDDVDFNVIHDVPVIVYENPMSSLFNVVYITEDMTTEDILNELE